MGNIKTELLFEIRFFRVLLDIIRDILEGVFRLMGIFDIFWVSMKRCMCYYLICFWIYFFRIFIGISISFMMLMSFLYRSFLVKRGVKEEI